MDKIKVFKIIQEILSNQFGVPKSEIENDTNLSTKFGLDSLDKIEIMMHIERTLKIHFNDAEENMFYDVVAICPTLGTIVDLVWEKLSTGTVKTKQIKTNDLYNKSVLELVSIIERQRAEIVKLKKGKNK